ncbi:metal ABC transporter permease [Desertibacillus haloalkaliphilus]|uniref:metal ABC transporter permease n=1 Tax=Desertibacillus haloalkaliphilus TaxID=1328930 RepID=UPI001C2713AC|nr:metal ABC transporter permease [Desertibacillus haloalkaliphilus]MBU8905698.1 metal ABC transporter permease [Desertibacillus haloalkaliphilus]
MELLSQLTFLERGIIAAVIIGLICPMVGAFLLVRRISIVSESLSHITLTGLSAGILLGQTITYLHVINPLYFGLVFSLAGSLLIEKLRQIYKHFEELAVPIILSTGVGLSAIFISLSEGGYNEWYAYLFGSIVSVTLEDLYFIIVTALIVVIILAVFYKEFVSISFDQEYAKISGISIKKLNFIFSLLIALVITISMKVVGILLVGAMVVLPTATSIQMAKSFKQVIGFGVLFAQAAMLIGIYLSYQLDIATGGVIVLVAIALLIIVSGVKSLIR